MLGRTCRAAIATGLAFGAGYAVGRWATGGNYWGGGVNWGGNNINVNRPVNVNTTVNNWQHNSVHRGGVAYNNTNVQQRYGELGFSFENRLADMSARLGGATRGYVSQ